MPYTTYNGLSQWNRGIPGTTLPNPPALLWPHGKKWSSRDWKTPPHNDFLSLDRLDWTDNPYVARWDYEQGRPGYIADCTTTQQPLKQQHIMSTPATSKTALRDKIEEEIVRTVPLYLPYLPYRFYDQSLHQKINYTRYPLILWISTLLTVFPATLTYLFTYLTYLPIFLPICNGSSLANLPTYLHTTVPAPLHLPSPFPS